MVREKPIRVVAAGTGERLCLCPIGKVGIELGDCKRFPLAIGNAGAATRGHLLVRFLDAKGELAEPRRNFFRKRPRRRQQLVRLGVEGFRRIVDQRDHALAGVVLECRREQAAPNDRGLLAVGRDQDGE